jgi:hypothetical protein
VANHVETICSGPCSALRQFRRHAGLIVIVIKVKNLFEMTGEVGGGKGIFLNGNPWKCDEDLIWKPPATTDPPAVTPKTPGDPATVAALETPSPDSQSIRSKKGPLDLYFNNSAIP